MNSWLREVTARRRPEGFVLNGEKWFVTSEGDPGFYLVLGVADGEQVMYRNLWPAIAKSMPDKRKKSEGKPDPEGYRRALEGLNSLPPLPARLFHPHEEYSTIRVESSALKAWLAPHAKKALPEPVLPARDWLSPRGSGCGRRRSRRWGRG